MSTSGSRRSSIAILFWRATSALRNLLRLFRTTPGAVLCRDKSPWRHLQDCSQFEAMLRRYPVHRIDSSGVTLGILKDFRGGHEKYVCACEELGVRFRVLDLIGADWLREVKGSDCDGFIVHPTAYSQPWKSLFDERMQIIAGDLKLPVHPNLNELWFYESKRRMAYWFEAHGVPHPETRVFYDRDEAFAFAATASYPLVCKTDLGSGSGGVMLVCRPGQAYRLIARAFSGGIAGRGRDPRDREWGTVLFQQYVPHAREYRVIQLGDSWFAHEKIMNPKTGMHSGSGQSSWSVPPVEVLEFCRTIALKGGFGAMNYDVFVDRKDRVLANELQVFFAAYNPSQMYCEGVPGRMRRDLAGWRFEEGLFCRNGCANLRVEEFVKNLLSARRREGKSE